MVDNYREVFRAIRLGDYPLFLEKLDILGDEMVTIDISILASQEGRLDMLRELKRRGHPWNTNVSEVAASNGHLDLLKWLRENNCPWNQQLVNMAASKDQRACMAWAIENGCIVSSDLMEWASENGSRDCMRYLINKGIGDIYAPCRSSVQANDVALLEWCYTWNYPANENTIIECMYNDCKESLSYLHEHGCPWDARAYREAKLRNSVRCLEYLHENGAPGDWPCPKCSICDRKKKEYIEKLSKKEKKTYLTWLSNDLVKSITQ